MRLDFNIYPLNPYFEIPNIFNFDLDLEDEFVRGESKFQYLTFF